MAIYLLYMISPVILAGYLLCVTGKSVTFDARNRKTFLVLFGVVMSAMIGLRHYGNGSGDSQFYYELWATMSETPFSALGETLANLDLENGFLITVWALSHAFPHPQFIFIFSGIFFTASICCFVSKNCQNVALALVVFNCLGMFNFMVQGMRQAIAMCICLFAFECCKNRNFVRFLLILILAMQFHASAIVFLPVYFIYGLKISPKGLAFFIAVAVAGCCALPYLFSVVNFFINDGYGASGGGIDDGSGNITILIYLSILATAFFLKPQNRTPLNDVGANAEDEEKKDKIYSLYFYLTCVAAIAMIMRNVVNGIVERAGCYYDFAQMALIPAVFENLDVRVKTIASYLVILLCFAMALHKATGGSVLIPYNFCWQ